MVVLTREQIEQRLVALHKASLELVSNLSTEDVLDYILRTAREQSGARYAALGVVDEDGGMERFIPTGIEEETMRAIGRHPVGKGLLGAVLKERQTIRVPKISRDSRRHGFPPNHPEMESFLGVPILLGDTLLGLIYLTEKEDYFEFTENDERVIETLAAYAAVAISNSRLYKDLLDRDSALSQRSEDLALLNDVASTLTASLELEDVLERTLERVMAYLKVEAGEIFLMDEASGDLKLAMHRGEAAEAFWTKDTFQPGEGFVGATAKLGKTLVSSDLQQDLRYLRRAVIDSNFQCLVSVPLLARGSVVGVMNVATRKNRPPDRREINLLGAIGAWAGITIENARLQRQARRLAILEERERIGMDLHDGIVQSIYAVGLALDFARMSIEDDPAQARAKIEQAIQGLNHTITDIRSYISDLRPRQFGGEGLVEGLQRLVDEFRANTNADARLAGPKEGLDSLPPAHANALFHICQEALSNAAKHSRATHIDVRLWRTRDRVILEVSDNGSGFDLEDKMNNGRGHGLANMHTRARKVGGDVEITTEGGQGTTLLAWVPVNGDANQ
jgi:signal transduction histidine kinase